MMSLTGLHTQPDIHNTTTPAHTEDISQLQ